MIQSPWTLPVGLGLALVFFLLLRGRALFESLRVHRLLRSDGSGRRLSEAEATLLYTRLLRTLRRRGFEKSATQTPLEFAAALPHPELATAVGEFTRLYNRVRFGRLPSTPGRLVELLRRVQEWQPAG